MVWLNVKPRRRLGTENLVSGVRVYGEKLVSVSGREYRTWDPFRSKLAASILKGLEIIPFDDGTRVLYLGASTGTTASHVSDLIGESGILFGVEASHRVGREFLENVASKRNNTIPIIADARRPDLYNSIFQQVDTVYCDIAQPDQTRISIENCNAYLQDHGCLILIVKSRSIDVTKSPSVVFREEANKLQTAGFEIRQIMNLEPFDKDHALILAHLEEKH